MGHARHGSTSTSVVVRNGRSSNGLQTPAHRTAKAVPLTRRYEINAIGADGALTHRNIVAPATPMFEDAFAGFSRGTLISTSEGPIAVEDLCPGIYIQTVDNGFMPLLWVGSMMVFPGMPEISDESVQLIRVTADSFGVGRPMQDLVLGPRARMMYRHPGCQQRFGSPAAFAPAHAFPDGDTTLALNLSAPVRLYHIALEGQQVVLANGMEVESFHPGSRADDRFDAEMLELFLSMFPQVHSIHEFGTMNYPRLTAVELDELRY